MTPGMAWWWYLFGPDTQRARLACTSGHWQVSYAGLHTVTLTSPRALIRALAAHGPCPCHLTPDQLLDPTRLPTAFWAGHPPWSPSRWPRRHTARHRRWWQAHLHCTRRARGDLTWAPAHPTADVSGARLHVDLRTNPHAWQAVVEFALAGDYHLHRHRGQVWLHRGGDDAPVWTQPPWPGPAPRGRVTRHRRGDLTWLPRPPSPPRPLRSPAPGRPTATSTGLLATTSGGWYLSGGRTPITFHRHPLPPGR